MLDTVKHRKELSPILLCGLCVGWNVKDDYEYSGDGTATYYNCAVYAALFPELDLTKVKDGQNVNVTISPAESIDMSLVQSTTGEMLWSKSYKLSMSTGELKFALIELPKEADHSASETKEVSNV